LKTETKTKYYVYFSVLGAFFVTAVLFNGLFMRPQIDKNYVPTVINGITASTSIVMGFAGLVVGLFPKMKK